MSEGIGHKKDKGLFVFPSVKHLIAGGFAGAVSRTCVSPLERLKILYQVQSSHDVKYKGIWNSLRTIGREEGIGGYFKGNGTNVIRMFPYSAVQFAAYEQFKKAMIKPGHDDLTPATRLGAGAAAGITSVTVTYPLDLIRTRLSVQTSQNFKYNGIANCAIVIVRSEGLLALYKGVFPTVLGIAPYVGLNFMCYETMKSFVRKNINPNPTTIQLLTCGGIAGAVAQTITYPLDVLRRVMQMQGFSAQYPVYGTLWNAVTRIYRTDNIRGFYKGLVPNYLKVVPSISISFVTYEKLKKLLGG